MKINNPQNFNGEFLATKKNINQWLSNQSEVTEILSGQLNTDVVPIVGITPINNQFVIDGTFITVNPNAYPQQTIKEKFDEIEDNTNLIETSGIIGNTISAIITGVVVGVYNSDKLQIFPTIKYEDGISTISIPELSIEEQYTIIYKKKLDDYSDDTDYSEYPLTFIAAEPNTKIIIRRYGNAALAPFQYKFNIDDEWQNYSRDEEITLSKVGDMVMFQNKRNQFCINANNYFNVESTGSFYARGQLNSLTNYSSPGTYAFYKLFENNDAVLSTPLFPDGNGNSGVFQRMFYGCMNLKEAEDIKFTTATGASVCQEMFFNCINLKHAPKINIQSITGAGVFASMFYNCASLEDAPELPSPKLPINSYRSMFQNCFKLKKAPELPATTIGQYVYCQMFQNCVSLEEPPTILPATQIEAYCYQSMFYNCKRISKAPQLNFTNAPNYSCQNMFYGCSALEEGPSALLPEVIEIAGFDYMFAGCEKLEKAPEIHAHSFAQYALRAAFQNCSKLIQAPTILSGVFTGTHAFNATFYGCTSLTEAPVIDFPATAANCCLQMFYGCTSLTEAPIIPSAVLTTNCYNGMFGNCSKLKSLEVHFTSWNPTGATTNWLNGAGSGGTFKCYSSLPDTPRDSSHIPVSWSIEYLN